MQTKVDTFVHFVYDGVSKSIPTAKLYIAFDYFIEGDQDGDSVSGGISGSAGGVARALDDEYGVLDIDTIRQLEIHTTDPKVFLTNLFSKFGRPHRFKSLKPFKTNQFNDTSRHAYHLQHL